MFLFWYFLKVTVNHFLLLDPIKYYNYYYHPGRLIYHLRFIIHEIVGIYCLYQISSRLHHNYHHLWTPFHVAILLFVIILLIDIVNAMKVSIYVDIKCALKIDFRETSRDIYGPYYHKFERISAYRKYWSYSTQDICPICLESYNFEEDNISLLKCGHIFHIECLDLIEIKRRHHIYKCPICIRKYDAQYDKYKLEQNFPKFWLQKKMNYPGNIS